MSFPGPLPDRDQNAEYVSGDIGAFVEALRRRPGKDIWLVGGSELIEGSGSGCGGRVHDRRDSGVDRKGHSAVPEKQPGAALKLKKHFPFDDVRHAPLRGVAVKAERPHLRQEGAHFQLNFSVAKRMTIKISKVVTWASMVYRLAVCAGVRSCRLCAFQFSAVKGEADNVGQDEQAAETLLEQGPERDVRSVDIMLAQHVQAGREDDDGAGDQRAHVQTVNGLQGFGQRFPLRRLGGQIPARWPDVHRAEPGGYAGDVQKQGDFVCHEFETSPNVNCGRFVAP